MILTKMLLPSILIITLTILPMMFVMLPAFISTHKEQDVFPDDKTMNKAKPLTLSMTISPTASSSSPPHTRNLVKGMSFVYNNGSFGPLFKNYTTLVLVAVALVSN